MTERFGLRALLALLAGILALVGSLQVVGAQEDVGQKIYKTVLKSTVWILVPNEATRSAAVATGTLVDRTKRLVITNYHVVSGSSRERVVVFFPSYNQGELIPERSYYLDQLSQDKGIRGRVFAVDDTRDLALIQLERVPEAAQALPLARTSIGPGQRVHSVGNPGRSGGLWLYTSGMVRQVYRKEWSVRSGDRKFDFRAKVVETSSPTNAGDSGGPLVNDRGELVAVTQGGAADAQLLSFFIDVSEVKAFLANHSIQGKSGVAATEKSRDQAPPAQEKATTEDSDKQEQLAAAKLKFAQTLAADGKTDRAKEYCEVILKTYASTEAAKEAKLLLDKLKR